MPGAQCESPDEFSNRIGGAYGRTMVEDEKFPANVPRPCVYGERACGRYNNNDNDDNTVIEEKVSNLTKNNARTRDERRRVADAFRRCSNRKT